MFITPYFGGCKYTNNFLFINKNIVFQHVVLLITCHPDRVPLCHLDRVPLCHLDRAERVERSPHPAFHPRKHSAHLPERNDRPSDNFLGDFMSDGAENGGKTPQNGTVHHVFRHFDVGRSERQHFPEETYTG